MPVASELAVKFLCCCDPLGDSIFDALKSAKVLLLPPDANGRQPFLPRRNPRDALDTRRVPLGKPAIAAILRARRWAQIVPAIIVSIPVPMVNVMSRPFSGHPKPRKPRGFVRPSSCPDEPVSLDLVNAAGTIARHCTVRVRTNTPSKDACLWIVAQYFLEFFCCNHQVKMPAILGEIK